MVHLEYSLQCPCKKKTQARSLEACKVLMALARARAALFAASAKTSAVKRPLPSFFASRLWEAEAPFASAETSPALPLSSFRPTLASRSRRRDALRLRRGGVARLGGVLLGLLLKGLRRGGVRRREFGREFRRRGGVRRRLLRRRGLRRGGVRRGGLRGGALRLRLRLGENERRQPM